MNWPESLPDCPLLSGFTSKPVSNVVRTAMDTGLPKSRRKATKKGIDYTYKMLFTKDELDLFWSFFYDSIAWGSLSFDWVDPITRDPATCWIMDEPSTAPPNGDNYIVSFKIQVWVM